MKRILLAFIMVFIFIPAALATGTLEHYNQSTEAQKPAQISWRLSGMGKLSGDMVLAPNNSLLLPLAGKIVCVDLQGKILWETKSSSSGSMGQPIIGFNDSIFTASASSVQETKLNGSNAWRFSVYSGAKAAKIPLLASGKENILYLPLTNALYAVNVAGHYMWMLSPWDSSEANSAKPNTTREFLACAADKQAFYVVYGEKKSGYKLSAISNQGKFLWTYWLGDITKAWLIPGEDGRIFATVSYKKSSSKKIASIKGKVYSFRSEAGNSPEWQYTLFTSSELSFPVLYKSKFLYLTGGNKLFSINADNGGLNWEVPLLKLVSPPVVTPQAEHIYAGSSDGDLFAVNQSGKMIWDRQLDSSIDRAPLVGPDGFLYVFTKKGSLYKIHDNLK